MSMEDNLKDSTINKRIELLAPAGSYDAFLAAVENGADAVYLGGKLLNARQFAGNFDDDELKRALDYAHARDVKVFMTLNTLVLDTEMQEALEYAAGAYEMGMDAFILQDMGLASNLKKVIPQLPIHASTQMTIYDNSGVSSLEKLGFSRAVLARELSLTEIRDICSNTSLEIEVFVHGALCICYSGQCLMSSIIGGRSGNRGKCAQPCRLPYSILKDGKNMGNGYLLSPKDICFIDHLYELISAGVTSLKVEGRMKSPEYVAAVVSIYRKYLDELQNRCIPGIKVSKEDEHKLLQSFNRGGFSKGYLMGKSGPDMMSYQKPKNWGTYLGSVLEQDRAAKAVKLKLDNSLANGDGIEIWSNRPSEESPGGIITKIVKNGKLVKQAEKGDTVWVSYIKEDVLKGSKVYKTSDRELLEAYGASFRKGTRKADVKAYFTLKSGQVPLLVLEDLEGNSAMAEGELLPQKAVSRPLTGDRIKEQLVKMGGTPFNVVETVLDIENDIVVPVSELNSIRRKAAELLEKKRIEGKLRKIDTKNGEIYKSLLHFPGNRHDTRKTAKISAMLYNIPEDLDLAVIDADRLYIPYRDLVDGTHKSSLNKLKNEGREIYAYIPSVIRENYRQLIKKTLNMAIKEVDGFLAGNPGVIQELKDMAAAAHLEGLKILGDHTLNILNSSSLYTFKELGLTGAMLSYELNLSQIIALRKPPDFDTELGVYGKIPVMTSEYCPVGGSIGKNSPEKCKALCTQGVYHLKDRKGEEFLVKCDCADCRSTIFNSSTLFIPELLKQAAGSGIQYMRLSFVDENPQEIYNIVKLHRQFSDCTCNFRAKEAIIEEIKSKGFTRGHFQRGV